MLYLTWNKLMKLCHVLVKQCHGDLLAQVLLNYDTTKILDYDEVLDALEHSH